MPPKDKPLECVQEEGEILYLVSPLELIKSIWPKFCSNLKIHHLGQLEAQVVWSGKWYNLATKLSLQFSASKEVVKQLDMMMANSGSHGLWLVDKNWKILDCTKSETTRRRVGGLRVTTIAWKQSSLAPDRWTVIGGSQYYIPPSIYSTSFHPSCPLIQFLARETFEIRANIFHTDCQLLLVREKRSQAGKLVGYTTQIWDTAVSMHVLKTWQNKSNITWLIISSILTSELYCVLLLFPLYVANSKTKSVLGF